MPRYDLNRSAPKPRRALVDLRSRRSARLIVALAVALGLAATFLSAETAAAATVTMWGNQRPAGVALDRDTKAVELGTKFVPTAAGKATGVRFYKVKGMKGTHTGTLWSASGKKLASVTFKKETSSGWQTASFGTPVALKAGTTYVVSYHVPAGGRYPATINFKGATTSSALKVGANSGVYKYSSKIAFPKSTWKSSQYWVDVVFAPTIKPAAKPSPTPTATVKPTPTPTPTATATVKPTPTPTPTATATVKPTPTPTPTTSAPAPSPTAGRYPTRTSAGLPAGWSPVREIKGDYWIRTAGTVLEDVRITNGTIFVAATNVTLRRVEGVGARVNNYAGATCGKGLLIEDSTFRRGSTELGDEPTIGAGGYTVRNVVIDGTAEGLRVGGKAACGDVVVQDSFLRILPPDQCRDWHGDGIQGYDGGKLTVRNTVIDFNESAGCGGTAAFFYPSGQGNTSVDIDRLIVSGGGYPFRLGMPGSVTNLGIVDRSWGYGSKEVTSCSALTKWQAKIVTLDTAGQPVAVRDLSC